MVKSIAGGARVPVARFAVALIAGLVVFVLLIPAGGVDTLPPQCWSVFGYGVPCSGGVSVAAGAATTAVIGVTLWLNGRRRGQKTRQ